jgi:hypothetical protein
MSKANKVTSRLFNTILVHVARTWERIRLEQPYQEMPTDNIESVDEIIQIADEILKDKVLQKLLVIDSKYIWDWSSETDFGCSDVYIESLAHKIITDNLQ